MAILEFEDMSFKEEGVMLVVRLYRLFEFYIPKDELFYIGEFRVTNSAIVFPNQPQKSAERKFLFLLGKHIHKLKNRITGNTATYVHKGSGIPLIGSISFGIVDRGSTLLEVKPVTSCNLNCIYCSVGEGIHSQLHDFVVERDYLLEELGKVVAFKASKDVEIHIGCQGEPLLYSQLVGLVRGAASIPSVSVVSMDTNGVLLSKEKIDELMGAGMNQFNISLNALDRQTASMMAGTAYDVTHVKAMAEYIAKRGARLVLAPVLLPGYNDRSIREVIEFGLSLGAIIGIQNFLEYRHGRRPVKPLTWHKFYSILEGLSKDYGRRFRLRREDFNIRKAPELPRPFAVGEIGLGRGICHGRYKNEIIVASRERSISVMGGQLGREQRFKILRNKHNIYLAEAL